jgi:hypothetical protein
MAGTSSAAAFIFSASSAGFTYVDQLCRSTYRTIAASLTPAPQPLLLQFQMMSGENIAVPGDLFSVADARKAVAFIKQHPPQLVKLLGADSTIIEDTGPALAQGGQVSVVLEQARFSGKFRSPGCRQMMGYLWATGVSGGDRQDPLHHLRLAELPIELFEDLPPVDVYHGASLCLKAEPNPKDPLAARDGTWGWGTRGPLYNLGTIVPGYLRLPLLPDEAEPRELDIQVYAEDQDCLVLCWRDHKAHFHRDER